MELEPVLFYISDLLQSPRVKHERDMDQWVRAIPTLKQERDQRLPVWWIRIKLRLVPTTKSRIWTTCIHLQSIKYHLQQNCISNLFLLQFLTYPYNCKTIIKDLENHFLPLYQPRHLTKRGCVGPSEQMLPHKTTSTPDRQRTTWPGSCKRKYICKVSLLVLFDIS